MAFDTHSLLAYTTVVTGTSPALTGNSFTVADGSTFSTNQQIIAWPAGVSNPTNTTAEVLRLTGNSSNIFTVARGQEGSAAQPISSGWQVAQVLTPKVLTDIEAQVTTNQSNIATNTTNTIANTANIATNTSSISTLNSKFPITESEMSLSDVATDNVSPTKHGFAPKAPNDATRYLDGTGAYSTPSLAIPTALIADSVTSQTSNDLELIPDLANNKVVTEGIIRQGGSATDWTVAGNTTYTEAISFEQWGAKLCGSTGNVTITFPIAFSQPPIVIVSLLNSSGATLVLKSISTTQAVFAGGATQDASSIVYWVARGKR